MVLISAYPEFLKANGPNDAAIAAALGIEELRLGRDLRGEVSSGWIRAFPLAVDTRRAAVEREKPLGKHFITTPLPKYRLEFWVQVCGHMRLEDAISAHEACNGLAR